MNPQPVPVDVSILEALVDGDKQIVDEVLREFCEVAVALGHELVDCCTGSRVMEAAEIAHKLKSSARSIGALKLGDLCADIESAGWSADIAACFRLAPQLDAELACVTAFLHALQRKSVADRQSA